MRSIFRPRGRRATRGLVSYRVPMMVVVLALLLGLVPTGVAAAPIGGWTTSGPVTLSHSEQPAVLLGNGKVLAVGGDIVDNQYGPPSHAAMLYNPATGTWNVTSSLIVGRIGHTVTLLASGKVLVAGGKTDIGTTNSAELYDPATGTWSMAGAMSTKRAYHTATILGNGKVLVAGGYEGTAWQSAELYDPATNSWSPTGSMLGARWWQTAVRLSSGKVLVVGGFQGSAALDTAELYDPAKGTWSGTGNLAAPRYFHAMILLNNGMVLVGGGHNPIIGQSTSSVERYDPATGSWTQVPGMLTPRSGHTMVTLPSGEVLANGGYFAGQTLATTEIYSPMANGWALTGGMANSRFQPTTIVLASGKVLTFGGYAVGPHETQLPVMNSELYDPATAVPIYALALTTAGPGSASAVPAGGFYPRGTTVVLYAKPDPGQIFLGLTQDGIARGWPYRFAVTMGGAHAIVMTFTTRPSFPDVPSGSPEYEAITQLAARGIIKGYGDGRFGPNDTTQRAQMAALIARAMGWDGEDWGNPFVDGNGIDGNLWRNVGTLAHYDVAKGYDATHFAPTDKVTKAQAISFITRAMVKKGYWQLHPDDPVLFTDVPAASGHRQDLVTFYYNGGFLPGQTGPDDQFADWNTPSTRGWFAQALWPALNYYFGYDDFI